MGDSRAYLLRDGQLRQLTLDHSWVADRVRQGILSEEEARQHRWRNVITNTLGSSPQVKLDLLHFKVQPGDTLLVCSDGVSMLLDEKRIAQVVTGADPEAATTALIAEANERGAPDNLTATVLRVDEVAFRYATGARNRPALDWLAQSGVGVINLSLAGPPNPLGVIVKSGVQPVDRAAD